MIAPEEQPNICPTCGQSVTLTDPVTVSLENNTLSYKGQAVRLTKTQAEAAAVLAHRMPLPVQKEYLIQRIWTLREGLNARNALHVHICNLRKQVKPLGLSITVVYDTCYSMVESHEH